MKLLSTSLALLLSHLTLDVQGQQTDRSTPPYVMPQKLTVHAVSRENKKQYMGCLTGSGRAILDPAKCANFTTEGSALTGYRLKGDHFCGLNGNKEIDCDHEDGLPPGLHWVEDHGFLGLIEGPEGGYFSELFHPNNDEHGTWVRTDMSGDAPVMLFWQDVK